MYGSVTEVGSRLSLRRTARAWKKRPRQSRFSKAVDAIDEGEASNYCSEQKIRGCGGLEEFTQE